MGTVLSRERGRAVSPLLLACILLLLAPLRPACARLVEQRAHNFTMTVPDRWVDLPFETQWSDLGIVYGARRELQKLDSGEPAHGEGGWLHVAVTDAPQGKDLDAIAADKGIQSFLMARFGDNWPDVEIVPADFEEGLPLRVLVATGETANLKGRTSPTRAVMLLTVAKGKLVQVRMYAWTSEYDDEGLKADLDVIERDFEVLDKTLEAPKPAGTPPESPEDPTKDAPIGDEDEQRVLGNPALGWKLTKPKGLISKTWDATAPAFEHVVGWFEGNRPSGGYQIVVYVVPRGGTGGDVRVRDWALESWWSQFTEAHPRGPVATWEWPRRAKTSLVLPDFADDRARRVIEDDPEKRPLEADANDLIKKLKVAEKVRNVALGAERTQETYRGNLEGNRPGVGREIVLRYAWTTSRLTCMVAISLTRDACENAAWVQCINELLASIEMTRES